MICKTAKFELERKSSKPTITKVEERLDLRRLIERATAGIIDLKQFEWPREADVHGSEVGDPANSQALDDLMSRPTSVMDNLFGSSVEDAEKELKRHHLVMSQNRKSAVEEKKEQSDADKEKKDLDAS